MRLSLPKEGECLYSAFYHVSETSAEDLSAELRVCPSKANCSELIYPLCSRDLTYIIPGYGLAPSIFA